MPTFTGDRIRQFRKARGLTQKQLGELCGIADSNIRKYESGRQNPKLETLKKIADALGVPTTSLCAGILPDVKNINLFAGAGTIEHALEALTAMTEDSNQAMAESIKDVAGAMAAMAKDEEELLSDYHNLNNYGKKEARKRVNELTEIPKYQKKDD